MVTKLRMLNELQIRLIFLAIILTLPLLIHESSSQPPSLPNSKYRPTTGNLPQAK